MGASSSSSSRSKSSKSADSALASAKRNYENRKRLLAEYKERVARDKQSAANRANKSLMDMHKKRLADLKQDVEDAKRSYDQLRGK